VHFFFWPARWRLEFFVLALSGQNHFAPWQTSASDSQTKKKKVWSRCTASEQRHSSETQTCELRDDKMRQRRVDVDVKPVPFRAQEAGRVLRKKNKDELEDEVVATRIGKPRHCCRKTRRYTINRPRSGRLRQPRNVCKRSAKRRLRTRQARSALRAHRRPLKSHVLPGAQQKYITRDEHCSTSAQQKYITRDEHCSMGAQQKYITRDEHLLRGVQQKYITLCSNLKHTQATVRGVQRDFFFGFFF
jgi:hypothetical protein